MTEEMDGNRNNQTEMASSEPENPFASLFFGTIPVAPIEKTSDDISNQQVLEPNEVQLADSVDEQTGTKDDYLFDEMVQSVFLFTVNECQQTTTGETDVKVLLNQLREKLSRQLGDDKVLYIEEGHLEEAIFERLLLQDANEHITPPLGVSSSKQEEVCENDVITYICSCYGRLCNFKLHTTNTSISATQLSSWTENVKEKLFTNCVTCLLTPPELYSGQNCQQQFVDVFTGKVTSTAMNEDVLNWFLAEFIDFAQKCDMCSLSELFFPIFNTISSSLAPIDVSVSLTMQPFVDLTVALLRDEQMCLLFMQYHQERDAWSGGLPNVSSPVDFQTSLLGRLLEKSTLVAAHTNVNLLGNTNLAIYFFRPSQSSKSDIQRQEQNLQAAMEKVTTYGYSVIGRLLAHKSCASRFHAWVADCIRANRARATLHGTQASDSEFASDGFFLNLATVCMKVVHKFTKQHPCSEKVLKVDPSYCRAPMHMSEGERDLSGVHFSFQEDTFVTKAPSQEGDEESSTNKLPVKSSYEPLTEMFFLAHKVFHLAFYRINAKLQDLLKHLRRLDQARQANANAQSWINKYDQALVRFFSIRVALNEPMFTTLAIDFLKTSSVMLCHYAQTDSRDEGSILMAPRIEQRTPTSGLSLLSCFPEIVVENISEFILYNRRFNEGDITPPVLADFQAFFIMFMAHKERLTNPHLRAKLAECLELTLAHDDFESRQSGGRSIAIGRSLDAKKAEGFQSIPLKDSVAYAIVKVFVDIEQSVSGDEIHFEQKFMYRKPMMKMLDIMWTIPHLRATMQNMAREAVEHIEAASVPVFVRFINLLLNDSIFLLDEGMQYITQIKNMERERESGEWARLGQLGGMQREANLRQLVHMANFHCVTATDIVNSLTLITHSIQDLFLHSTFVHRVASMLNYFLNKLVGSERNNLAVKSALTGTQVQFKAKKLVKDICYIYKNLTETSPSSSSAITAPHDSLEKSENAKVLAAAIVRDARSYSSGLFVSAVEVLYKISTSREEVEGEVTQQLIDSIHQLGQVCKSAESELEAEDDDVTDAPEEFLDPIMSVLMLDPVTLPSSGTTLDRGTIARHLLTDQTDPFNRQPLTMEQVQPNKELKEKIEEWLKLRRNNRMTQETSDINEKPQLNTETESDMANLISIKKSEPAEKKINLDEGASNSGEEGSSADQNSNLTIDYSPLDNLD